MIMCSLKNQSLYGEIEYRWDSYIVRVYSVNRYERDLDRKFANIYAMSFGNGVKAEDRLIELLEHPAWTLLKYG